MTAQQQAPEGVAEPPAPASPSEAFVAQRTALRLMLALEGIGVSSEVVRVVTYPARAREILLGGSVDQVAKLASWIEEHR